MMVRYFISQLTLLALRLGEGGADKITDRPVVAKLKLCGRHVMQAFLGSFQRSQQVRGGGDQAGVGYLFLGRKRVMRNKRNHAACVVENFLLPLTGKL